MPIIVAACQVPDIRENPDATLEWIERFTKQAGEKGISYGPIFKGLSWD